VVASGFFQPEFGTPTTYTKGELFDFARKGVDVPIPWTTPCRACGRAVWMGNRCHWKGCPSWRHVWKLDREYVFWSYFADRGPVRLISLTAPGKDTLPFDRRLCTHPEAEACSGGKGCRVKLDTARWWWGLAKRDLRPILDTVKRRVHRRTGSWPEVAYVKELQKRGVPHIHFATPDGTQGMLFHRYLVQEMKRSMVWGFVDRKRVVLEGGTAARYLAKYLAKEDPSEQDAIFGRERVFYLPRTWQRASHVTVRAMETGRRVEAKSRRGEVVRGSDRYAIRGLRLLDLRTGEIMRECILVPQES
jgi:hypothetical protein